MGLSLLFLMVLGLAPFLMELELGMGTILELELGLGPRVVLVSLLELGLGLELSRMGMGLELSRMGMGQSRMGRPLTS